RRSNAGTAWACIATFYNYGTLLELCRCRPNVGCGSRLGKSRGEQNESACPQAADDDPTEGPSWAKAQSRCAPARCAGARAERAVGEDRSSTGEPHPENRGVATLTQNGAPHERD